MFADDLDPSEYAVRWQARNILAELTAPGLDPECSLKSIRDLTLAPIRSAAFRLELAQGRAENHDPAQPDDPAADTWCGWCGSTKDLIDDGLIPLTGERIGDPAWVCADTPACVARRRVRYPDGDVSAERQALALAQEQAAPALLALVAFTAATSRQATVALSASRSAAQPRPGPLYGEAYRRARWSYTVSGATR
jgi:hypothetical protein